VTGSSYAVEASPRVSPHSRGVTLAFAALFGVFGAHRFYTGRVGSGVVQAVTLGGLGIWALYDVIIVATGNFRDARGRRVLNWEPTDMDDPDNDLPPAVAAELTALREELDELHERLDFTERMLARLPSTSGEGRS
jgi:hypothetical protein